MITILEIGETLRRRKISPVELTRECLGRVEKLNSKLNAFITITAESALEEARRAAEEIAQGSWRGPLHGIPIGLKDLIDTAGVLTTAASELYRHRVPTADAEVVRKLRQAGAVILGKQNLHEFAYGASSLISCFGEVRNPWNIGHITGGSSGGSAAAVAAGMGYASIGTDTAGSIREPAALCGVVGIKPTYGRVSAQGVIPLSVSLDHVGPFATRVADCAVMLQAISVANGGNAHDISDWLTAGGRPIKGLRVGVPRSYFYDDLDAEVAASVEEALRVMQELGAELRDVTLVPDNDRTVQAAEAYEVHAETVARSPELYQPETLRRIKTGEQFSPEEIQQRRAALAAAREEIQKTFDSVDVIVTPTTPIPAPAIAELRQNPELLRPRELLLLRNTRPFNVWGIPAISLPCGLTASGLPIGLQIAGAAGRDELVLQTALAYEQATDWHQKSPE